MIPATTERVPQNTAEHINQWIRERTRASVAACSQAGPAAVARRLRELDREWDIERTLEANAGALGFAGGALALLVDRRFALLPLVVGGFLFQHAVQGWCPPVPVFRRLGVRTEVEIDEERTALKALRGDFKHAAAGPAPARAERALDAARA